MREEGILGKRMNQRMKKMRPFKTQKRTSERWFFSSLTSGALIIDHSKKQGFF
jgi:hypothetical protein